MPTLYSSIFKKVNILFQDAGLLERLTDSELDELLEIFLSKSKSIYFKGCKKDLTDVDDVLKQFNPTLSDEEEWVLAEGIKFVWLENQIFREEKLRNRMTSRDYDESSPANLLDKLTKLRDSAEKNLQKMTVGYSFNGFEGFN